MVSSPAVCKVKFEVKLGSGSKRGNYLMRTRRRWQGPGEQIKEWGGGGEERGGVLVRGQERRAEMSCCYGRGRGWWVGSASRRGREKMGMKEECVCSTGSSGMNRTVGYVTAIFGSLMNLSLPALWILSCYCWQHHCSINTLIRTNTQSDQLHF